MAKGFEIAEAFITVSTDVDEKALDKATDKIKGGLNDVEKNGVKSLKSSMDSSGGATRKYGDRIGGVGEKADGAETRIMGMRDLVDGMAVVMQGPGEAGFSAYLQGLADTASGIANFVVPALSSMAGNMVSTAKTAVVSAGQHVVSAARVAGGWVLMGVQSLLAAAKVALAWLISIGPIALVIAAVVGLVVLIVKNFDKIKEVIGAVWEWLQDVVPKVWDSVKRAFQAGVDFIKNLFLNFTPLGLIIKNFDKIKEVATGAKDWIVEKFNQVVDFFKNLPERIGRAVAGLWDGIKTAFRSAINWVIRKWNDFSFSAGFTLPSIFGGGRVEVGFNTPNIPLLAQGGIATQPMLAGLAERGSEAVIPLDGRGIGILAQAMRQAIGGMNTMQQNFTLREDRLEAPDVQTFLRRARWEAKTAGI